MKSKGRTFKFLSITRRAAGRNYDEIDLEDRYNGWKYFIPFFCTAKQLAKDLHKAADWLETQ